MKKIVLLSLFLLILLGFFFAAKEIALAWLDLVDVYVSEIDPKNLLVGETVSGRVRVTLVCSGDTTESSQASVDFGDGSGSQAIGTCTCVSHAGHQPREAKCTFGFSHTYNSAGTFLVSPSTGGNVGMAAAGAPEEIIVSEPPAAPGPSQGDDNPLEDKTIAELAKRIANFVFYILSGFAVMFIMIGGYVIMTAAGSPERITRGRKIILFTVIGYAIMLISRGIVNLVYKMLDMDITV